MQLLFLQARRTASLLADPAVQIAVGLAALLVALFFQSHPACTGMSLVALGATAATSKRLRQSPARTPLLLSHGLVYSAIYLLFIGSTLDAATRLAGGLSPFARLDLAASLMPMAVAAGVIAAAIRQPLTSDL